jgi:hypothetical protein
VRQIGEQPYGDGHLPSLQDAGAVGRT